MMKLGQLDERCHRTTWAADGVLLTLEDEFEGYSIYICTIIYICIYIYSWVKPFSPESLPPKWHMAGLRLSYFLFQFQPDKLTHPMVR